MSVTKIVTVRRHGFTLVELLVVIAIIGVLMGLLMPAIMNARLAALQATCLNNERELASAMILFDSNKDRLPYVGKNGSNYTTWYDQILEELGLGKFAEAITDGNFSNTAVKQFKCPVSDAPVNSFSYMANVGTSSLWGKTNTSNPDKNVRGSGLLFYYFGKGSSYTKSSISSIKDGASMTILLSEKCYQRVPGHSGNISTEYSPNENWATQSGNDNAYKRFGLCWGDSSINTSSYYNFPTSRHSQVNNIAFADGSVKAVSKGIQYSTYKSLMCPSDTDAGIGNINIGTDPNYK